MYQRIPIGTLITTFDQVEELSTDTLSVVVIDRDGTLWIVFQNEDGDDFAITAECPDEGIPAQLGFWGLCERGPLRVVFNGDTSTEAWGGREQHNEVKP
ncbi:hypothetical protein [Kribbella endophytica]